MLPSLVALFQPKRHHLFGRYLKPAFCEQNRYLANANDREGPTSHNNPFRMTNHVIGQERYSQFLIHCRIEFSFANTASIAILTKDPQNIFVLEERIKQTASALITIDHNRGEPGFSDGFDL